MLLLLPKSPGTTHLMTAVGLLRVRDRHRRSGTGQMGLRLCGGELERNNDMIKYFGPNAPPLLLALHSLDDS